MPSRFWLCQLLLEWMVICWPGPGTRLPWSGSPVLCLVARLCPTLQPWTVAHQAPLSQGFPRQEYCSGLPCPPPGDLPNPGIQLRSATWQADSLPSDPSGKPKNTGVRSPSLLQRIFLIQELNWGLLHCR